MKPPLRPAVFLCLLAACRPAPFEGQVYDIERQQPVAGVLVRSTTAATRTDGTGHFSLPKDGQTRQLVFAKPGYTPDTVDTNSLRAGEFLTERFGGKDTLFLFRAGSRFRDSIFQLNRPRP